MVHSQRLAQIKNSLLQFVFKNIVCKSDTYMTSSSMLPASIKSPLLLFFFFFTSNGAPALSHSVFKFSIGYALANA